MPIKYFEWNTLAINYVAAPTSFSWFSIGPLRVVGGVGVPQHQIYLVAFFVFIIMVSAVGISKLDISFVGTKKGNDIIRHNGSNFTGCFFPRVFKILTSLSLPC